MSYLLTLFAAMYDLILTRKAQRFYEQADKSLTSRLNRCFDQLCQNPYQHPNIKALKGRLSGRFRYRIGNWRVIYTVDDSQQQITILLIASRGQVYD
ncbi:type II toxin-antitoxin system RelE/ParE family toxin [Crocosphaera sp. XPORK-15E]|uniref:type II toxin-antitoxin system RelE family toxin n=1 Tax=Crocosphaera sp. XPORK-15E TaxID=3110247 RepID=UPI002B20E919|nr:type II toxin-antitoxin system RelE/ParE family toxin [Crocosphaera sp. XPORK-15E]MEA5535293.1 type II toxin-antitoxin system RelE/ParE family toxin [Crocosphaera sp. XPORK-15E]